MRWRRAHAAMARDFPATLSHTLVHSGGRPGVARHCRPPSAAIHHCNAGAACRRPRKVLAVTALSLGLQAHALQVVASDGVAVEAIVSLKEPTRIRIEGASITDVFGNVHSSHCGGAAPAISAAPATPPGTPGLATQPRSHPHRSIRPATSSSNATATKGRSTSGPSATDPPITSSCRRPRPPTHCCKCRSDTGRHHRHS